MKTILSGFLWGCLLGFPGTLNAVAVLWDGLEEPSASPSPSLSLSGGTTIGLYVSVSHHSRVSLLQGYVGMPVRPTTMGLMPPALPTVTLSLWEWDENTLLSVGVAPFAGFGLLGPIQTTESGLRVWNVGCALDDLGWELNAGRSYVVGVSLDEGAEWLVHGSATDRSMVNRGGGWEDLDSNLGWNARLQVTPMPEAAGLGIAAVSLLGFGMLRRCCSRCRSVAR